MAFVKMTVQISGTRDGVDWPKPGGVVEVPQSEADDLVTAGMAEHCDAPCDPRGEADEPKRRAR